MGWGFPKYVPVAKQQERARKKIAKLKKKGMKIFPVKPEGRKIVTTFWGESWCNHIESFSDFDNRLPRGRRYIRNGSVCHLEINQGEIKAIVSGSELYNVTIKIKPLIASKWAVIKKTCQGKITSVLELLSGKLSNGVMDIVCHQRDGLFPLEGEINLDCNCMDWAQMCKHVAAVLYGVGTRLDSNPDELFKLRMVDYKEMIDVSQVVSDITSKQDGQSKRLSTESVANLFNLELEDDLPAQVGIKKKAIISRKPIVLTGSSIRKQRKVLSLTKAACALRIGVSVGTLAKWELFGRKKIKATAASIKKLDCLWSDVS